MHSSILQEVKESFLVSSNPNPNPIKTDVQILLLVNDLRLTMLIRKSIVTEKPVSKVF